MFHLLYLDGVEDKAQQCPKFGLQFLLQCRHRLVEIWAEPLLFECLGYGLELVLRTWGFQQSVYRVEYTAIPCYCPELPSLVVGLYRTVHLRSTRYGAVL